MSNSTEKKSSRLLSLYAQFVGGQVIKKAELADYYHISERSVQRDIEELRCYLANHGADQEIIYDSQEKGFRLLTSQRMALTNDEILAVCEILLESRSLPEVQMNQILDKLVDRCVPTSNQKMVKNLIANEAHHYVPPRHNKNILKGLWELGQAIQEHRVVQIEYQRVNGPKTVTRRIQPVGLMFSEFYFYLTAFLEDKSHFENPDDMYPTIYRLDRIIDFTVLSEHFRVPYAERFEEGEFRKRVQFMYGGKLRTIRFLYTGPSVEAVLDRLPTAKIVEELETGYVITAEVFGKGIDMWLKSQGDYITVQGDKNE